MIEQKYIDRFWKKVDKDSNPNGCWEWTGWKELGYGHLKYKTETIKAHRFSVMIDGRDPSGLFVCHSCDNPSCVNPNHLFLGTLQDNHKDMMNKGRNKSGNALNKKTKLNEQQILEIRNSKESNTALSKIYNIAGSSIRKIKNKTIWKHI